MSPASLNRAVAALGAVSLACGSVLLLASPATAADLGTASDATQLASLITAANLDATADTITLTGSGFTLAEDLPAITHPLTITGPGSDAFTLNADGFDAFDLTATAGAATISGLTITQAGTTASHYAIATTDVSLTLEDIAVLQSFGGLNAVGGSVDVSDSSFTDNAQDGIHLHLDAAPGAVLDDLTLSDNVGDGLDANLEGSASLTVTNSTADRNKNAGFYINASEDALVHVSDSSADGDSDSGLWLTAIGQVSATFTGVTSTNTREDDGIRVRSEDSAVVSFTGTTSSNSDDDGIQAFMEGSSSLTMTRSTVTGAGADGADLNPDDGATIVVDDLTADDSDGNGLDLQAGTSSSITLSHVTVTNSHDGVGAQLSASQSGRIEIRTSTISGSDNQGVRILSKDGDASGAVVTITDTTIRDNGNDDNGFYGGGILISEPNGLTADIVNSTISGNTAFGGGGIYSESPDEEEDPQVLHLSLVDSTVSGNVALTVGGVFVNGGSLSEDSTVDILNSTITANTTESGGPAGAALLGGFTPVIRNSIIAGNIDLPGEFGDLDLFDVDSELDVAYSLIGVPSSHASAAVGAGIGNLTGVDPLLGPLADNGGPTLTHLPQSDSPVVGAGDPAFTGLVTDQRGRARVIGVLDMGAVETQPELASTGAANAIPVVAGALLLLVLGGGLLLGRRRLAAR